MQITEDETEELAPPVGPGTRVLVMTAAAVAILLLGAAVGLLVRLPGADTTNNPGTGSVEVGFAQDMSVHHLQAVTLANWAREHTADPAIRQLAFDIQSTQLEQVGRMKGWLMLWGQPEQPPTGKYMAWMAGPDSHGMAGMTMASAMPSGGVDHMPGYASAEEISKLQSLSGAALDSYFLQLMLRHHEGGAPMAQFAADHSGVPAVRVLAQNILASQAAEVKTLKELMTARGVEALPGN
ncbi:DUF305 domain-containing protein [Kutzneria viridogrisea]|uniref:Uncharacterized protein (DUF305 family) n=1 Tax=Kutzneria viridogrisea TaxID=47990 RepID=A0ABR6BHC4_9PSEU|nr:uncharacterized protein (DUF305 family) [Kutzneria viridogrisea]